MTSYLCTCLILFLPLSLHQQRPTQLSLLAGLLIMINTGRELYCSRQCCAVRSCTEQRQGLLQV